VRPGIREGRPLGYRGEGSLQATGDVQFVKERHASDRSSRISSQGAFGPLLIGSS
jgi:hypothetical protein